MNSILPDVDLVSGFVPVNLATGANTGLRVGMRNARRALIVLYKDASSAEEDPIITVLQHTAAAGGTSKALDFERFYYKADTTLTAATPWVTVVQPLVNTATVQGIGRKQAIIAIEIDVESMDHTNGFVFLSANVADVGNAAQLGGLFYLVTQHRLA